MVQMMMTMMSGRLGREGRGSGAIPNYSDGKVSCDMPALPKVISELLRVLVGLLWHTWKASWVPEGH